MSTITRQIIPRFSYFVTARHRARLPLKSSIQIRFSSGIMISHPPAQCCTIGVKHEGEAVGEMTNIGKTSTYISYPKDKSTEFGVVIIPDVMGHDSINAQLIADQFSANGYFTVLMDPFQGDPIPLNRPKDFNMQKWRDGPPSKHPQDVDPIVTEVIKGMRDEYNVKKLGAVGYCFGGKYVARFLGATGKQNGATVDAGYTAHPSWLEEDELKAIEGPLSIAAAEVDDIFPEENRHLAEKILKELSQGSKHIGYQVNLFSSVRHGFATRADLSDKKQKFAKEKAFLQAVHWFDHYLKES